MKIISRLKISLTVILFFVFAISSAQSYLPPGFIDSFVSNNWNSIVCFKFDGNGQMYACEKRGKIWVVDTSGVKQTTPLLDITEEVGNWGDNGFTGFCLDPDFLNNGYMYLFYTVDRHYLLYYGTPQYDSTVNEYQNATICRITRYQADSATNFKTLVAGSRFILLGEDKKHGIPLLYPAHSGAALLFGRDSSLIVCTSDGASYGDLDTGSVPSTFWAQAIADSIIPPEHNVGAFRSLLKNSLNGKILRLDRMTGNGLNSNPYFDSTDVRSPPSRTYATGFRNPFRSSIIPNTGSTDITAGDPGVLLVGDVGWNTWEELDIIKTGGGNYGWPVFEGITRELLYANAEIPDYEAPNPLYGVGACTQQYLYFGQTIDQPVLGGTPPFPNPCDTTQKIPDSLTSIHTRPDIDWRHNYAITRVPGFQGSVAVSIQITAPASTVTGDMFEGNTSIGGVYYTGTSFPPLYHNSYFHVDYGQGWIRNFQLDVNHNLTHVAEFDTGSIGPGSIVFLNMDPRTGCLMYIQYKTTIRKICYTGQVNYPPNAVATADTIYGLTPLTVQLTGSNSTDPENHPLTYLWDFGDGSFSSNLPNPLHTFTALPGVPTVYTVTLTVKDDSNYVSSTTLKVFINDSPPSVQITSIAPNTLYSILTTTNIPLQANVSDAESPDSVLYYEWETVLHHNQHEHSESLDNDSVTYTILTPIGCNGELFFYRISLKVVDPQGMEGNDYEDVYPDCGQFADFNLATSGTLGLIVSPNPTHQNFVNLRIVDKTNFKSNDAIIDVINIDGRIILSKKIALVPGTKMVDVHLQSDKLTAAGMYFIKVTTKENQTFSKFIKY
ncbi:MAG: PQQ-dependent sugar dehydrogenase [Bacteroidia bacterium]